MQKLLTFCQQKYYHICHINDQSFKDTLTNGIVSFEQLGPGFLNTIAQIRHHFQLKVTDIFYISMKTYVVALIRSPSYECPQHMFSWRNKKNMWIPLLIWS